MELTIGHIITLLIFLVIHGGGVIAFAVRSDMRGRSNTEDIKKSNTSVNSLGAKVDANMERCFREFVTVGRCESINQNWQTFVDGLLEKRDLWNDQNQKDHERIVKAIEDFIADEKIARIETASVLVEIKKCMRKIQKKEECEDV